jgi:hypothetical protein
MGLEVSAGSCSGLLESEYEDLQRELGGTPRGNIPVILYTGQAFFYVT